VAWVWWRWRNEIGKKRRGRVRERGDEEKRRKTLTGAGDEDGETRERRGRGEGALMDGRVSRTKQRSEVKPLSSGRGHHLDVAICECAANYAADGAHLARGVPAEVVPQVSKQGRIPGR
jgi:hypothetical protein